MANSQTLFSIDTTLGSFFHHFTTYSYSKKGKPPKVARIILLSICLTYLLMLIFSILGPLSIWERTEESLKLPFLWDVNIACMFLISFPLLIFLTLRDEWVLIDAIQTLQQDEILEIPVEESQKLQLKWKAIFRKVNRYAQIVGIAWGITLIILNYHAYIPPELGFWIAKNGQLLFVGWIFLLSICVFYAIWVLYVFRGITIAFFLKDLVKYSKLSMIPGHPDRCGGLRPIGQVGLRNQFLLSILGFNLLLFWFVSKVFLQDISTIQGLIILAALAYVIFGPIAFFAPLMAFKGEMQSIKSELLRDVSRRIHRELKRVRSELEQGSITKEDEELIQRLRKVWAVIDELPVWPFDLSTRLKFITAYIIPILGSLGGLSQAPKILNLLTSLT